MMDRKEANVSRRKALQIFAMAETSVVFGVPLWESSAVFSDKTVRFGLISDSHYADRKVKGPRFYVGVGEKMETCITEFKKQNLDFIVHFGDMKDKHPTQKYEGYLNFFDRQRKS
ncbi:MAG: hypothetical protein WBG48_17985 [Pricia sp.]